MELHTVGVDLDETVFHLVGLNLRGEVAVRQKFSRTQLQRFTANIRGEMIGMEACGGAHFPVSALSAHNASRCLSSVALIVRRAARSH
jgi:transposase